MNKDFIKQLRNYSPVLCDINRFILDAEKLGYGEIELTIKTHNYLAKIVELKAVKPNKETLAKSITKKIMVKK